MFVFRAWKELWLMADFHVTNVVLLCRQHAWVLIFHQPKILIYLFVTMCSKKREGSKQMIFTKKHCMHYTFFFTIKEG